MDNLNKVLNPQRPILSGLLQKYTNVMKGKEEIYLQKLHIKLIIFLGYQLRFCRVDAENGTLSYFLNEHNEEQLIPRGKVQLIGALINPSDEDSRTFTINSSSGDQIKFKANDAKSRQEWVMN